MRTSIRRLAQQVAHDVAEGSHGGRVRKPLIHFLGKEGWANSGGPHAPRPHPAAPQEVVDSFQSFLAKLQSTGSASNPPSKPKDQSLEDSKQGKVVQSGPGSQPSSGGSSAAKSSGGGGSGAVDFEEWWKAPTRLTTTKPLEPAEIEAIESGGAA